MNTEKNILEAAKNLFMQFGIKTITMDDIANKAGVSKKTIYQHFKDKNSIVSNSVKSHFEEQKSIILQAIESTDDALDAIFKISHCMKSQVENSNPTVLYDLKRYYPKAYKEFSKYKNDFMRKQFSGVLEKGVASGYFRKEIDIEILVIARIEQVQSAFDMEVFPREKFDFRHVQQQLFEHFIHGLLTEKGKEIFNHKYNNEHEA